METIVAYDFDGTLISCDSLPKFIRKIASLRRILATLVVLSPQLALAVMIHSRRSGAKMKLLQRLLKGMSQARAERLCEELAAELDGFIRPELARKVEEYREAGCRQMVVSASCGLWIRPWATRCGLGVIASEMEEHDGKWCFTTPICKGEEKVRRFLAEYPARNEYRLIYYGDSLRNDGPMLSLADDGEIL